MFIGEEVIVMPRGRGYGRRRSFGRRRRSFGRRRGRATRGIRIGHRM